MRNSTWTDILGNQIKKGDFVAIAQRSGNSGSLTVAVILDTMIKDEYGHDIHMIRVLGSGRNWNTGAFEANTRHGDSFPDRVVVINESVPGELAVALQAAYQKYWAKQNG